MFHNLLLICMFLLSLSVVVSLYRLVRGTMADRILALDMIGYNIIGIVGLLSIIMDTTAFLEIILLIGVLAFLSTVALCKYLEGGKVIEYRRDD